VISLGASDTEGAAKPIWGVLRAEGRSTFGFLQEILRWDCNGAECTWRYMRTGKSPFAAVHSRNHEQPLTGHSTFAGMTIVATQHASSGFFITGRLSADCLRDRAVAERKGALGLAAAFSCAIAVSQPHPLVTHILGFKAVRISRTFGFRVVSAL
jgi:hypothetical protein